MPLVCAVGCFDLLHPGHHDFLRRAARLGDLFLLIDSDARVAQLKGPGRPLVPLVHRLAMLRDLRCVKGAASFGSDDALRWFLKNLAPQVLVKGRGSGPTPGQEYCGRVEFLELLPGWSTSGIVRRIRDGS